MLSLRNKRVVVFAEGCFGPVTSKVATSYLRYRHSDCVAVVDSRRAGQDVGHILGYGHGIPVLDSLESALGLKPDVFLVGVGLFTNELPSAWREQIASAIEHGLDVVSGLHFRIADDPEFQTLAVQSGSAIWDTKEPPAELATNEAKLGDLSNFIVHTVGSDCRVGKKTTAIEIAANANRRGFKTAFVATGQSGIYISGAGVAIDAVPADFIAGVTEALVLDAATDHDWIVVEGQGAISHPAYSGVTLGLLHGAMPQALVLCHEARLESHKGWPHASLRPLNELIEVYERLASFLRPATVVGVSVHCGGLEPDQAMRAIEAIEHETGLPATDVIQFGADKLVNALASRYQSLQKLAA